MVRLFGVFVSILLVAPMTLLLAQPARQDSLLRVLSDTRDSRTRVDILLQLSFDFYDIDAEQGYRYATNAHAEAAQVNYPAGLSEALTLEGYYFYAIGDYTNALLLYYRSMGTRGNTAAQRGYTFVLTGNAYREQAQYDSAELYYRRGIAALGEVRSRFLAFAYRNLARLCVVQWRNDEALEYFNTALGLYEQQLSITGKAETLFLLSELSLHLSNYAEANSFVAKGCGLASRTANTLLHMRCLLYEGRMLYRAGEYTQALDKFFIIIGMLKGRTHPELLLEVYNATGLVYDAQGQSDLALKYFFAALKLADKGGMKLAIADLYCSIGWVYKDQFNYSLAHEFVSKSQAIRNVIGDANGLAECYNTSALIHYQQRHYGQAIVLLEESLTIRRKLSYREGISAVVFNLGMVYEEMGDLAKALSYQKESLVLDEQIGNPYGLGVSYNTLGGLYTKLRQFQDAERFLLLGEKTAGATGSRLLLMNNARLWSAYYEHRGNLRQALEHQKVYSALHDSIFSDNSAGRLAELQALYEVEKKDEQIQSLNAQQQLQKDKIKFQHERLRLQNIIMVAVIVCFVLVSLFAIKSYQYTRRMGQANREILEQKEEIQAQSEELIEANQTIAGNNRELELKVDERTLALRQAYQELDTFFYRSSHDFRRPLTTFMGLAEVAKITVKDTTALELFARVSETASNLDRMLVKLQSISDVGGQHLVYREVLVRDMFDALCDRFREDLDRKQIHASAEITLSAPLYSYPAMINVILENLFENAIFFSGVVNPYLKLHVYEQYETVVFLLEDNGQGIDRQYQDRIFEMYFRGSDRSKGNGLGLYIVQKAVQKLGGRLEFETEYGVGTKFWIYLRRD